MEILGQTLGNYRIDSLLGEGGTGDVYKAYDLARQRDVALKLVHSHLAHQPSFRERFSTKLREAAEMDHAGIVKVLDFGQHKDQLYVVMEYLHGANLRRLLDELINKRKWLPLEHALLMIEELCQTVEYARSRGVLLRDIDPNNLILKPDLHNQTRPFQIVLTDLGLGEILEKPGVTHEGTVLGEPAYMSPEQVLGKETDARSSVYSLGILLYELVVGLLPFSIRNITEAILYHTKEVPPPPRSILPKLPEELERVILKALEKDPDNRYQNAAELESALTGAITASGTLRNADTPHDVSLFAKKPESLLEPSQAGSITVWEEAEEAKTEFQPAAEVSSARILPTISIEVKDKDGTPQLFTFQFATVSFGRGKDNQIVLDDPKVSRQHGRVTWDGTNYYVTDLNSSNGIYMEKQRLQPEAPQVWDPRHEIRIGGFTLRLVSETSSHTIIEGPPPIAREPAVELREPISVTPQQLTAEAGTGVTAIVSVFNPGPLVDRFTLSVNGIPEEWAPHLPLQVDVEAGQTKDIPLTVDIPRVPEARAGRHQIMIQAASQRNPVKNLAVRLTLTVAAYTQFRTELNPQRLQTDQAGQLTIANQGNLRETFNVFFADDLNDLSFQPPQFQVRIAEGHSAITEFRAQLRRFRLLGGEKTHPFSAQVSLPRGEPQILRGDVVSRALLPVWVPAIFVPFFCLLMAGLLFIIAPPIPIPGLGKSTSTVTPTAELTLTPSATPEPGAPTVEEWCVYLKDQPPSSFTNCPIQVKAMPGQVLIIHWRVSNATQLTVDPIGDQPFSGEIQYEVTTTTTQISLRANNAENKKNQKTTQIIVVLPTATMTPITPSSTPNTPSSTPITPTPPTATKSSTPTTPSPTPVPLTAIITVNNKPYDGTKSATFSCELNGVKVSDDVDCAGGSATFFSKNIGTWDVTITGLTLSGADAAKYRLSSTSAADSAQITPAMLTASINANDKTYDGNVSASFTCILSGTKLLDTVTCVGGSATFSSKNAGQQRTVTATGLALSGPDAGNYTVNDTATDPANISPATLTPSIIAEDKIDDDTTSAEFKCNLSGVIAPDNVSCSGGTATFEDAEVGNDKLVTATGLGLSGSDAGNYVLATTTATDRANITPKP